jgi:hypothetical protein
MRPPQTGVFGEVQQMRPPHNGVFWGVQKWPVRSGWDRSGPGGLTCAKFGRHSVVKNYSSTSMERGAGGE